MNAFACSPETLALTPDDFIKNTTETAVVFSMLLSDASNVLI